ncbi:MAG: hypothetical protein NZ957_02480 [Thaumarchaeota archaeon]|nr:hypothetical protein [Candidatus Calditenuaceae archaeon]
MRDELQRYQNELLRSRSSEEARIWLDQINRLQQQISRLVEENNRLQQRLQEYARAPPPTPPPPSLDPLIAELQRLRSEEAQRYQILQSLFQQMLSQRDSTSARAIEDTIRNLQREIETLRQERAELERQIRELQRAPPPPAPTAPPPLPPLLAFILRRPLISRLIGQTPPPIR